MKFKYKYTALLYALFCLIYALALACFIWNGIRLINTVKGKFALSTYEYISIGICLLLPIVAIVFVTAMLIKSEYKLDGESLIIRFGFLVEKYKVSDITNVVKGEQGNSLAIYFADGNAYKINIDEKMHDDFTAEIIKINKAIIYDIVSGNDKKEQ